MKLLVSVVLAILAGARPATAQYRYQSYQPLLQNDYDQRQDIQRQLQDLRDEQDRMRREAIDREAAMQQLIEDRISQQRFEDELFGRR